MPRKRTREYIPPVEAIKMRGAVEWALRNASTGEMVRRGRAENAVVFRGREWVLRRMGSNQDANYIQAIAFGTIDTNNDSSQTKMGGYATIKSIGTTAITTASAGTPSHSWSLSFNSNETWTESTAIKEIALYNSSATGSGTMLARATASINFQSTNTLAVTYTVSN